MSDSQSDLFLSMLKHVIVPVRATEFADVETGLNTFIQISSNVSTVMAKRWQSAASFSCLLTVCSKMAALQNKLWRFQKKMAILNNAP